MIDIQLALLYLIVDKCGSGTVVEPNKTVIFTTVYSKCSIHCFHNLLAFIVSDSVGYTLNYDDCSDEAIDKFCIYVKSTVFMYGDSRSRDLTYAI